MTIDLSKLPAPEVIEPLDFETILATIKADLLAIAPELAAVLALESEPVSKLLEVFAWRELLLRARINDAAKSTMLAYARGADLEHLAALLGVARLADEPDDRLRARAQLSLEGVSTAGPRLSYVYHAMSASAQVADVHVDSPVPGQVRVVVLAQVSADNPGGVPDADLLAQVEHALNADNVRPLCDLVSVQPAHVLTYAVSGVLVCRPGPGLDAVLQAANSACAQYVRERFRLGDVVAISGLHAALQQPGIVKVTLTSPSNDLQATSLQALRCTGINMTLSVSSE